MSEPPTDPAAAARKQKLRRQAEQRIIVQATMQANRTGMLPHGAKSQPGSDILTALIVVAIVFGLLFLVIHYGH